MTKRSMKSGIEVLEDLVSFFESSPAFISVACEKLRKTHGPTFKLSTVKALLNLRTDLTKEERLMALKVCGEILDSFKNIDYTNSNNKRGIFSNLDTTQAEKIEKDDIVDMIDSRNEMDEINIEDFLKEGGINIDDIEEESEEKKIVEEEEFKQESTYNTDPDDQMKGYLVYSSIKLEGEENGEDIVG